MHSRYVDLIAHKSQQLCNINFSGYCKGFYFLIRFKKVHSNNEEGLLVEKRKLEQQLWFRDNAEFINQHLT